MLTNLDEPQLAGAAEPHAETQLEAPLAALEALLARLAQALQRPEADAIDRVAGELHAALAAAVDRFQRAAKSGSGIPPALRRRLAAASAQVASQREALARATASLDRAIDVLMPRTVPGALYSAAGSADRVLPVGGVAA